MMEREYIVTVKNKEDLETLYEDLETIGGCNCIPSREVSCVNRRPISRNTHYHLTDEEAELIRKDPRVLSVELSFEERGVKIKPSYTIESSATEEQLRELSNDPSYTLTTTTWSKSTNNQDSMRPWALYRCVNGATVANWGANGTLSISGTVLFTNTGKNVDVVVVDGCFNPNHPEFAVNEAGTGGSRVNQFNWFSLNPEVTGGAAETYLYTDPGFTYGNGSTDQQNDNNHGCHVAGTMAGNRRGWARDATIYNINPYSTAPSVVSNSILIDYIRAWHNSKDINPITGLKNPTITNHSYEVNYDINISDIDYVIYQGTQYNAPLTSTQLTNFGLINNGTTILGIPYLSTAMEADIQDAINDGIIFVGAAGNSSFKIDRSGGQDYDNIIKETGFSPEYYNRGASPASLDRVICVGAVDANVVEEKATYSNCGPRIDVYAPGSNIISSVHSNSPGVSDSRNTGYENIKYNGTSMASPNVAGVLACIAEQWPRMNQNEVLTYFNSDNQQSQSPLSTLDQLNDGTGTRSLQDSENRYLFYPKIRKVPNPAGTIYIGGQTTSQQTWPRLDNKFRSNLNFAYPRDGDYQSLTGDINEDIINQGYGETNGFPSPTKMIYPRHPIWNRSLT